LRKAIAGALVAAAVMAGCGGDDEDTTTEGNQAAPPATEAAPSETTATETQPSAGGTAAEEIPTYEEVAEIALQNESTKRRCDASGREDRDIGSYPEGDTYKRLFCGGAPAMDYVVGKEPVTENFDAASEQRSPLWRLDDIAYAKGPALDDEFAQKVKDACDCGEVVQGTRK
jgi:hypothetical protein